MLTDRELIEKLVGELDFYYGFIAKMKYINGQPIVVPSESCANLIAEARAVLAAPVVPDTQAQELQRLRAHIQEAADDAEYDKAAPWRYIRDWHLAALKERKHVD